MLLNLDLWPSLFVWVQKWFLNVIVWWIVRLLCLWRESRRQNISQMLRTQGLWNKVQCDAEIIFQLSNLQMRFLCQMTTWNLKPPVLRGELEAHLPSFQCYGTYCDQGWVCLNTHTQSIAAGRHDKGDKILSGSHPGPLIKSSSTLCHTEMWLI